MTDPAQRARLAFLSRVIIKETDHLLITNGRVFSQPMTPERAQRLTDDIEDSEQVDAFVSRFGRLQDTLGNRLLPELLDALGESVGAVIDNLDRAEKLGLVSSAEQWMVVRRLRNQMVHEYIESSSVLSDALESGHAFASELEATSVAMIRMLGAHEWGDKATIEKFLAARGSS